MRPYTEGESFFNLIKTVVPDFIEADYPIFVEFLTAFVRFLEEKRVLDTETIFPPFGGTANVKVTDTLGGPLYETRKLLEYRDVATSLDEFNTHFNAMFAANFPNRSHISADMFVRSLRQFYKAKGTPQSFEWIFRTLFNQTAQVYFPREDILKASDSTWNAPTTLKVSSPIDGHDNEDVAKYYVGQKIESATGSAEVERVVTNIIGLGTSQQVIVNELFLRVGSVVGSFNSGQEITNVLTSNAEIVQTTVSVLPVIEDLIVLSGGSNYIVGDIITFSEGPSGGYGTGAFATVKAVTNTGINRVSIIAGGDGYIVGLPITFTSSTGTGARGVVETVVYGDLLNQTDDDGYILLENTVVGETSRITFEDKNVLDLELTIEPFCNAIAVVNINSTDYGTDASVPSLVTVGFDSFIELALVATDNKPFMHPWVFTDLAETQAKLANAAVTLQLPSNTFFANATNVYSISSFQDITTNLTTSQITANTIVSDVTLGSNQNRLFLDTIVGANLLQVGTIFKEVGNGVQQTGTVATSGPNSANVVGTGTVFVSTLKPNTHILLNNTTPVVVKTVVNNTFLTTYTQIASQVVANTFSVLKTGQVTDITLQAQHYYGKIIEIQLLSAGANYITPPAVTADSVSGRAQELFYFNPANSTVIAAAGQIEVFTAANLAVVASFGQITKVNIISSGVNYINANDIVITAHHSGGRTGDDAEFSPVLGSLSNLLGEFTSTRSFLSSNKYLQDSTFYNNYTYVIRVGESFDRYKNLVLKLLHPAGFKMLGEVLAVTSLTAPSLTANTEAVTVV